MALPLQTPYSLDYIYSLPDGERAELIDGQIYDMAPPNRMHQEISFTLSRKIADYIDSNGGSCKVYPAPFAVFLNDDNMNYVEPDISAICDKNKLSDKGCHGAPDWIIEIVSPATRTRDYGIKLFKYRSVGVREYWIVDPANKRVCVYNFGNDEMNEYTFSDTVKAGIYSDLAINFAELNI